MANTDTIRGSEESIEPSPQFAARVMAAVRKEAMMPPPLPFPWRRVAIGASLGIATSAVLSASPAVTSRTDDTLTAIARVSDAIDPVLLGVAGAAVLVSFATVKSILWFAGRGD
jgi:hypothetical protein